MITSKKYPSNDLNVASHIYHTIDGKVCKPKEITKEDFLFSDIEIPEVIYKNRILYIGEYGDGDTNVDLNKNLRKRAGLFAGDKYYPDSVVVKGSDINYINNILEEHPKHIIIDYHDIEDMDFHEIKFGLEIKNLTHHYETFGFHPTITITDSEIPVLLIDRCIGLHIHIENCKIGKIVFVDKDTTISFNMFDSEVDEIDFTEGHTEFIRTRVENSIIKKFTYDPESLNGHVQNNYRDSIWRISTYSDIENLNIDNLKIIKNNCRISCDSK